MGARRAPDRRAARPIDLFDPLALAGPDGKTQERMLIARRRDDGIATCFALEGTDGLRVGGAVLDTNPLTTGLSPFREGLPCGLHRSQEYRRAPPIGNRSSRTNGSAAIYAWTALYEELGGLDAIFAVCRRWNELCVADPVAEHPFTHPRLHPHHHERLASYLAEVTGGPVLYTAGYGDESHVQRIHAGNGVHLELDEVCVRLFDDALADCGIPREPAARLSSYFRAATEAMRTYQASASLVPDGLALRRV